MTRAIDLNADLGEYHDATGQQRERAILALVSSCNIACGGHAGDADSMRFVLAEAAHHRVAAGAHPSYPDRSNFGRQSINIGAAELRHSLHQQIATLKAHGDTLGIELTHLKPHGALYNDAADDPELALLVATSVVHVAAHAVLVGPPRSALASAAEQAGVGFRAEGFVDRRYLPNGRLVPRSQAEAIVEALDERVAQALQIVERECVPSNAGPIALSVDTLCLHGDSDDAVATARKVRSALEQRGVEIRAWANRR